MKRKAHYTMREFDKTLLQLLSDKTIAKVHFDTEKAARNYYARFRALLLEKQIGDFIKSSQQKNTLYFWIIASQLSLKLTLELKTKIDNEAVELQYKQTCIRTLITPTEMLARVRGSIGVSVSETIESRIENYLLSLGYNRVLAGGVRGAVAMISDEEEPLPIEIVKEKIAARVASGSLQVAHADIICKLLEEAINEKRD